MRCESCRVGWQADQRPHSPAAGEMHAAQGKSGKAFQTLEDAPLPDTGPLPEPSTSRALAVHYAQHATAEDDAGRFESAFRLYKEALSHFEAAIKKSDPGKVLPPSRPNSSLSYGLGPTPHMVQVWAAQA